uniref:Uncharacterized protein n=1 Tax=Kalanchoe fedtschenkoi TaxID=63787 RepID=A0A7N0V0J6_KALFE
MDNVSGDLRHERSRSSHGMKISGSSFEKHSTEDLLSSTSLDDEENRSVSEAGDIGDRALHSTRFSNCGSSHSFVHEDGHVLIVEDEALQANNSWSREQFSSRVGPAVSPLASEITSSFPPNTVDLAIDKNQDVENGLPPTLDYVSCLLHLSVCGIFGVITRYLLQKLYGPEVAGVTNIGSVLYLDLPSNMVGSFLMGWWGVVLKADISTISEHLAIGLTTGYLGSLTTFSGWNQKMLDLSVNGQWVYASLGFCFGLFLVAGSILFGVATAKGFKGLLVELNTRSTNQWRVKSYKSHLTVMIALLLVLGVLLVASGLLDAKEFRNGGSEAQLWLACFLAPIGVWIRWTLARLNGRGIGKSGQFNWVPFGTLAANIGAASMMAALATVKKAVNTKNCDTVASGIQFGLLGCMSTVSTFMAEFHAMSQSSRPWRAFAYAAITIVPSFCVGILIYCIPVWTKPYN